jgi:hypothetical protein
VAGWGKAPDPPPSKPIDWTTYTGTLCEDHTIAVYVWLRWADGVGEYATRRLDAVDRLERALILLGDEPC